MSTRSTRSMYGGVRSPMAENTSSKNSSEFSNYDDILTKRSMRSRKCKNTPGLQTETNPVLEENHTRKVLSEKLNIAGQSSLMDVHSKNKRSRKRASNDPSAEVVEIKIPNKKIKNIDEANVIAETELSVKLSTRKSTRNNKHTAVLNTDNSCLPGLASERFVEVNKENENGNITILKTKKKSKRGKEIIIETSFKSDDTDTSLPSKRGSTGAAPREAASAPRTRRALRSNLDKPTEILKDEVLLAATKQKGRNKKSNSKASDKIIAENISATDDKNVKNLSNISNDTLYHSLESPDHPNSIRKDESSFSSVKEFDLSDSKHSSLTKLNSNGVEAKTRVNISVPKICKIKSGSSNSDISEILNETYPILVDDSMSSNSSFKNKISSTFIMSSKESSSVDASGFMKNSRNNMRISGIEEILAGNVPVTRKSLKREGTYTKEEASTVPAVNSSFNKAIDTSHNQSQFSRRHVFSAASPCKLFPKKSSFNSDKGKISAHNFTFTKTPPKSICRAISVGSAGRTPMPPPDKSSQKCVVIEEKSTPVKKLALLNVTHSLEKPKEQEVEASTVPDASVNKKTKVGFCAMNKNHVSRIPNPSKIIKSNLKGSSKSFTFSNSVTKQGTRKRSLTQNDAEARGGKIRKLGLRELNVRPKTPASAGKHLYAKANASLCSTTPAKQPLKLAAPVSRSKMPDFASLHKKQFEQMESLVQNKARKAERAKQLLFPNLPEELKPCIKPAVAKDEKPSTNLFSKTSADLGFTRFGFKLQSDSQKNVMKPYPLPVAKSNQRSEARKVVMREDKVSAVEKRRMDNRNYVRGVRTNRRFELQMQSRNLPA